MTDHSGALNHCVTPPPSSSAALVKAFNRMCSLQCAVMRAQSACFRSMSSKLRQDRDRTCAVSQPQPSGAAAVPVTVTAQPVAPVSSQVPAASAAGAPAVEQPASLQQQAPPPTGAPVPAGEPAEAHMEVEDVATSREQGVAEPEVSGSRPACVRALVRSTPAGLGSGSLPQKCAKVVAGSSPRDLRPGT